MDDSSVWPRSVSFCPPALLMALDEEASVTRLPHSLMETWAQAWRDALSLAQPMGARSESTHGPAPVSVKPPTQKLDTAEFFAISAQLERVNKDIESSRPLELRERVKALAVDELDQHMFDTLMPSQRAQGRQVVQFFTARQYELALPCLLQLVNDCPAEKRTAALYNNEAVCYYRLERWPHSKLACERALSLYADLDVCRRRLARIALAMGDPAAATAEALPYKQAPQWAGEWRAIKAYEAYTLLLHSQQYAHAMRELDALLAAFPCAAFESLKVQLLSIESTPEAVAYGRAARVRYPFSTDLCFWEAELAFHSASTAAALHEVIKMLQTASAPKTDTRFRMSELRARADLAVLTHVEALEHEARWEELATACASCLEQRHILHDGMRLALYAARAAALTHTRQWYGGLDDALRASNYTESVAQKAALLLLASQCEEGLQRFKDALHHAEQSHRLAPSASTAARIRTLQGLFTQYTERRQAREREQQQQARQEPFTPADGTHYEDEPRHSTHDHSSTPMSQSASMKAHFDALGVAESATALEVRRVYRALALRWHPDRWSGATAGEAAAAEQRFKEVQHAYEAVMGTLSL